MEDRTIEDIKALTKAEADLLRMCTKGGALIVISFHNVPDIIVHIHKLRTALLEVPYYRNWIWACITAWIKRVEADCNIVID